MKVALRCGSCAKTVKSLVFLSKEGYCSDCRTATARWARESNLRLEKQKKEKIEKQVKAQLAKERAEVEERVHQAKLRPKLNVNEEREIRLDD